MKKDRYIDQIFDGRWKVVEKIQEPDDRYFQCKYRIINIYNDEEMTIPYVTMVRIYNNETTVNSVRKSRLKQDHKYMERRIGYDS